MKKKKQIKKNSNLKKKRIKKNRKQSNPRGGSNSPKMVSETVALYNEPRKHRLLGDRIYNI